MTNPQHIIPLATLLGTAALWLMLPRGNVRGRAAGMILAAVALGLGASQLRPLGNMDRRRAVLRPGRRDHRGRLGRGHVSQSGLLRHLVRHDAGGRGRSVPLTGADFLAVATLAVYAGAILVTFLFVLMLAQPEGDAPYDRVSWEALLCVDHRRGDCRHPDDDARAGLDAAPCRTW